MLTMQLFHDYYCVVVIEGEGGSVRVKQYLPELLDICITFVLSVCED